jgi:Mg-chelatase subunit ChlD
MSENKLFDAIEEIQGIRDKHTTTANGAKTLSSTGSKILDLFSRGAAMRKQAIESLKASKSIRNKGKASKLTNTSFEDQLIKSDLYKLFNESLIENAKLTILCLFYFRDVRGGQGERSLFRVLFKELVNKDIYNSLINQVIKFIPTYGRFDDLLYSLKGTEIYSSALDIIRVQLSKDLEAIKENDKASISLCAKWLPSETSGKVSKLLAKDIIKYLGINSKQYRVMLSFLRKHLNIVETYMCNKEWDQIDYSHVPSKASLMYRKTFIKHDEVRYNKFISSVEKGEAKIHAGTLYPYEIVRSILSKHGYYASFNDSIRDKTLEQLWLALPDYIGDNCNNAIAVVDTSGSMLNVISGKGDNAIQAIDVSVSLGLYLAERNKSNIWKDKFITFSTSPALVTITGNNVTERIYNLRNAPWSGSTNLQGVFDLILNTASKFNLKQEDLPEVIYIISDMQFNNACSCNTKTNLQVIDSKFKEAGYVRPKLVFWNVNASNQESPAGFNENNIALFSGFSPSVFKSVLGDSCNPYDTMIETLISERYLPIIQALDL